MEHVTLKAVGAVAEVTLERGKVNALDERLVDELADVFRALEADPAVRAVVLTGRGAFFSFGFDVPHLVRYSKEEFIAHWLKRFTGLYRQLFSFPKPLVAALNGHAVAGGCMLALTADLRLMAPGKAKVALNELTFGSSVFAGAIEMVRFVIGDRHASTLLYEGRMYDCEQARQLGLVDEVVPADQLLAQAHLAANRLGGREPAAFASIKRELRRAAAEVIAQRDEASMREFADIWYSPGTWRQVQEIKIR